MNFIVQPTAIDAAIANWYATTGLKPHWCRSCWIAAEQPKLPTTAPLFQHFTKIAKKFFQILIPP
jgi:hypothetical protein